ncbi:RNA-directed DNA polymerase (reversetranscriptase)-related family protein, partial [Striga asiatica]
VEEADLILKLPLSLCGSKDRLIWHYTPNRIFPVKSAYQVAQERQFRTDQKLFWSRIWKLNVKKKICHFIWRCCHGVLAIGEKLFSKGMMVERICHSCGEGVESLEHILFNCEKAKQVRRLAPVQWIMIEKQDQGDRVVGASEQPEVEVGWILVSTSAKTNGDGSVGMGGVAWNADGQKLRAWCSFRDPATGIEEDILASIRLALVNAVQEGWKKIIIQVDNQAIAQKLSQKRCFSRSQSVIAEDIYLLLLLFESCTFTVSSKFGRLASCRVSDFALMGESSFVWMSPLPDWI